MDIPFYTRLLLFLCSVCLGLSDLGPFLQRGAVYLA